MNLTQSTSLRASPGCPSCGGLGWVTIMADRLMVANGVCRCIGGSCWKHPVDTTGKEGDA